MRTAEEIMSDNLTKTQILLRELKDAIEKWAVIKRMDKINPDDDVFTIEDFASCVDDGMFIDYDGFGYLATNYRKSDILVKPSSFHKMPMPKWATHVVWYNR